MPERPELLTEVPARVLAVYAHPDDPDVSCGGTLARWAAAGSEVHVVVCAAGDKGTSDPDTDPDELAIRRAEESRRAAATLGAAGVHLLGHPDGEFDDGPELRSELVRLIRSVRPEVLVCPDPLAVFFGEHYYNHRDHRVVGWAALDAASPAAASPLYNRDAGPVHTVSVAYLSGSLEPTVFVDIGATVERKAEAVLCHASQLGEQGEWFRTVVREHAEEAGRRVGVAYAEGYRRVRLGH